jgi:hypothetical protein
MVIRFISHPVVALLTALVLAGLTRFLNNPILDLALWLLAAIVLGMAFGEAIGKRHSVAPASGLQARAHPGFVAAYRRALLQSGRETTLDTGRDDALANELRKWRPDGKAGELKARVYSEMPNLTIREADQLWPFLLYIYENPFTDVDLKPVEGNSTGSCLGTIHLSPVSSFTIERPCGVATILWGFLDQMVTRVRNEAYSDAKLSHRALSEPKSVTDPKN